MTRERPVAPVLGSTAAMEMTADPANRSRIAAAAVVWLVCYALTVLLYLPFLSAPYYSDDFLFYFAPPPPHIYDFFRMPGASAQVYRPAESIILSIIQSRFGFHTIAIHLIAITAHASLCAMVWLAATRLNFTRLGIVASVAYMLLTQASPPAILGNDAMSQAMGAALAALSVLIAGIAYRNQAYLDRAGNFRAAPNLLDIAGAFVFFAGLLFKETGLGLILPIALLTFLPAFREAGWLSGVKIMVARMLPYAVLTIAYVVLRLGAGGHLSGGGSYHIGFGLNVPRNLLEEVIALMNPVSSVAVFLAVTAKNYGALLLAAFGTGLVAISFAVALWHPPPGHVTEFLLLCAASALIPAILLQHVSELYAYNAAPYFALLVGLAAAALWQSPHNAPRLKRALALGLALAIGAQIFADRRKAALMYVNGKAAERLLPAMRAYIDRMPAHSEIVLAQPTTEGPKYSIYLLHGLDVLEFGCEHLGAIFGRPDVAIRLVPMQQATGVAADSRRLILELKNGRLQALSSGS